MIRNSKLLKTPNIILITPVLDSLFSVKSTGATVPASRTVKFQTWEICSTFSLNWRAKRSWMWWEMRSSGCYPKCNTVQYSIQKTQTQIDWPANWTASVFIFPKSSIVEYTYEYFSYDWNDLIGDIGGYLGLFLGWSLITFFDALPTIIALMKIKTKKQY